MKESNSFLIAGFSGAFIVKLFSLSDYIFWFLSSIIHEGGHMFFALYAGCPAIPAIRLDGHAMCLQRDQVIWAALLLWILIGTVANTNRRYLGNGFFIILAVYPLTAFIPPVREILHLLSGHIAELVIGGVFLWRGLTGKSVQQAADRFASAVLGSYLFLSNSWLCFSISFIRSSRMKYYENGSFGLTNDYIRIADEILGVPLQAVAVPMLFVCLAGLVLTCYAARPFIDR